MENYICINGKKAELTEEQLKALGIELPSKTIFTMEKDEVYYFISSCGSVIETTTNVNRDVRYNAANYCTDKAILKQRAFRETLNRLLWRYSMEHDADKMNWSENKSKWAIAREGNDFKIYNFNFYYYIGAVYFHTEEIAEAAIEEVIKPFMKAHPEFKW